MNTGATIVIDIGKTLSKVTLWDPSGRMIDRAVRPNGHVSLDGSRRLDHAGIAEWLVGELRRQSAHPIETIIPVGHGAAVVALDGDATAFAPLDYEQSVPPDIVAAYRARRDPFAVTGSPALPDGLNIGTQLYWLDQLYPHARDTTLLPWAQYWSWFLTGTAVSEVTSLGCHSDLWAPRTGEFAPMARALGWAQRFAPIFGAADVVGTLRPDLARRTGLAANVRVLAGLHDSNAALLAARGHAEIAGKEATILSTGTWFIAMRTPGADSGDMSFTTSLPEARDCLVNVDAFGACVPSSRFMGGREIELLIETEDRQVDILSDQPALLAAVPEILASEAMVLPTLTPGCGPFPDAARAVVNHPDEWVQRRVAACLYAALVADASLDLIGASERLVVEGRFAQAEVFVRALASLRPDCAIYTATAHNDVSFGALRLAHPALRPQGELVRVLPLDDDLAPYAARWAAEANVAA